MSHNDRVGGQYNIMEVSGLSTEGVTSCTGIQSMQESDIDKTNGSKIQ
jgi:hypothetical protein